MTDDQVEVTATVLQTVAEKVQAILEDAAAQISTLMKRGGDAVHIGHFMAALIWDLSEEQVAEIKEGGEEPPPHLKFVSNMEDDAYMEFLAQVAEILAQDNVTRTETPTQHQ